MPARPAPTEHTLDASNAQLCCFEWEAAGASDGSPALLFAHATGFHARVWDAIIELFPDRRILAIDQRGHGRSTGKPITDWRVLIDDMACIAEHFDLRDAIGIGHSMGAHVLLHTASELPDAFKQLVLFDPVILEPEFYTAPEPFFTADNPHPTSKRKRDFASPEAMMERFSTRDPYDIFDPRVFEDYCRYGLLPAPTGDGYELACPPEVEASVYGSSRSNGAVLEAAKAVKAPVTIIRAKRTQLLDFKSSPTWPGLAGIIPNGTDLYRPDKTHFHPFEDPADAAKIIADTL